MDDSGYPHLWKPPFHEKFEKIRKMRQNLVICNRKLLRMAHRNIVDLPITDGDFP